jgi:hypothetical protein
MIIPHGQPGISDITWWGLGQIFREVKVCSIGGGLNIDDSASNQHDSNPATATPLLYWLSTKHYLIDLTKKAFSASESKNTRKKVETRNLKLQI